MANEVFDLVVKGKAKLVAAAVQTALDGGADPNELLTRSLFLRCWFPLAP